MQEQQQGLNDERNSLAVSQHDIEEACNKMKKQLKHETELRMVNVRLTLKLIFYFIQYIFI